MQGMSSSPSTFLPITINHKLAHLFECLQSAGIEAVIVMVNTQSLQYTYSGTSTGQNFLTHQLAFGSDFQNFCRTMCPGDLSNDVPDVPDQKPIDQNNSYYFSDADVKPDYDTITMILEDSNKSLNSDSVGPLVNKNTATVPRDHTIVLHDQTTVSHDQTTVPLDQTTFSHDQTKIIKKNRVKKKTGVCVKRKLQTMNKKTRQRKKTGLVETCDDTENTDVMETEDEDDNKPDLSTDIESKLNDDNHDIRAYMYVDKHGNKVKKSLSELYVKTTTDGIDAYDCILCEFNGVDHSRIQLHVEDHRDKQCPLCFKTFSKRGVLAQHLITHKERPFMCSKCFKLFTTKEVRDVHEAAHEKKVKCQVCGKTFDNLGRYNTHMKVHKPKTLKCDMCEEAFHFSDQLKKHKLRHGPKEQVCDKCGMAFYERWKLSQHIKENHCDTEVKTLTCDLCQQTFVNKRRFWYHKQTHDSSNVKQCEICGVSFTQNGSLKVHMESVHKGQKNHVCKTCGKKFARLTTLRRHEIAHEDKREFQCGFCPMTFKSKNALNGHVNVHTKEKKYTCEMCGKSFLRYSSLYLHKQWHENKDQKHKCRYCSESFRNDHAQFTHIKASHYEEDLNHDKPIMKQCQICHRVFVKKALVDHMDMHKGIKRHKCEKCEKLFASKSSLRNHLKVVHDYGKFLCTFCDRKFMDEASFQRHQFRYHNSNREYDVSQCNVHFTDASSYHEQCPVVSQYSATLGASSEPTADNSEYATFTDY